MATATTETLQLVVASMSSFHYWEEAIYTYGVPLVIGALLTVYRREMSCNRVFHDEEESESEESEGDDSNNTTHNNSTTTAQANNENCNIQGGRVLPSSEAANESFCFISDEMEAEAEELLDGAGLYCSGQPILAVASVWLEYFTTGASGVVPRASPSSADHISDKEDEDLFPSDLLDHAGIFSVEPIVAAMALAMIMKQKVKHTTTANVQAEPATTTSSYDPLANELPQDVHVHITSFLHPKDVVTLSCVSKSYREVIDYGPESNAIWKTLWERDYAWIVHKWDIGRKALRRSSIINPSSSFSPFVIDKEFYFTFVCCYMNYVLAGQNTQDSCLVGLHSHIYDITNFLDDHPGSPDTIMVHAGRDCTNFFEDMNHSMIARRIAKRLCVVADVSHLGSGNNNNDSNDDGCSWGVRPTAHTVVVNVDTNDHADENDGDIRATNIINNNNFINNGLLLPQRYDVEAGENLLLVRGRRRQQQQQGGRTNKKSGGGGGGTLNYIRDRFNKQQNDVKQRVVKGEILCPNALDEITPFYDPFQKEWNVWYTSHDMERVFLPAT